MRVFLKSLVLLLVFSACQTKNPSSIHFNLNGEWQFKKEGDSTWLKAQIPGTVQSDLFANKKIPDLFYEDNEQTNKWIENENWTYSKRFVWEDKLEYASLVFEGLDTYSEVFLNGHLVLETDNMFRTYEVEIDELLQKGENEIIIKFFSPIKTTEPLFDAQPYSLPADNDRNDKQTSVFTRKAPYQYGWDWGPRYVTMGVWRPVYIKSWNGFKVSETRLHQTELNTEMATVAWDAEIYTDYESQLNCQIKLENNIVLERKIKLEKGINYIKDTFAIVNPKLWWPNGYGEAKLYKFDINLSTNSHQFNSSKKLGFRTVELVTEKDSIGESFYFKVNGSPVYAKGANYIPQDNILPNVDSSRYALLIRSAKDANMNMLRVWGGGIYENDFFYDLCDENGILVWQDFMFACSLYPGDTAFLQNVEEEARDNIKRIRDHPSLALWCGNNEISELWHNWGYQKKFGYSEQEEKEIWRNYQKLFNELLPNLVDELNPKTDYWESSPKIGWGHKESMTDGDSHYWGVWWGKEPFEVYEEKVPRFSSEFGFQSLPQMSTILSFADSNQLNLESEAMQAHQKSSIGNRTILEYMERDFPVPENFEGFVYVSQLVQAYGVGKALEAQRRAKPNCMGTLYWQLNDCWPGISWSSLDYFGNWKVLHYEAQHDFDTFLVSREGESIYVVSDSLDGVNTDFQIRVMNFKGIVVFEKNINLNIQPNSSEIVYTLPTEVLESSQANQILIDVKLFANAKELANNIFYLLPPKELLLPKESEVEYVINDTELLLWSKSGALIKNIYVQSLENHYFDKNYIDILPQDTIRLKYFPETKSPTGLSFKMFNDLQSR